MGAFPRETIIGSKEKIFLTGHTGFKGTWLTLLLEELGHEVVGYSLNATADSLYKRLNRENSINEVIADIRDRDRLDKAIKDSKPSIVIHMAAQPLVLESYLNPRETFEINSQGTANVLEASFRTESVTVIGAVTTDKVYKNLETTHSYIETDALEGTSDPYSASKVAAEAVICGWKKIAAVNGGPSIVTLRSGNVIGGGDFSKDRLIPDLIRSFQSGNPVRIRNLESTRPWMHVLDSLTGYLSAINFSSLENTHNTYNFAPTDKSLTVGEVLDICLDEWPGMFTYESDSTVKSNSEANLLNLNPNKAMSELNWSPNWSQETAVRSTISWWKSTLIENVSAQELCGIELSRANINQ